MYEDLLPLVAKPARYIDSEVNAVRKDLASVRTKICLFFPDAYEVGMSHLGLRILYHILNSRPDTACERVFSPWTDYEERLRASGRPLTSLESGLPLSRFDIIGITLQYELSYTNVLTGLALGGIPLRSTDRSDDHPVIIAGGPCAVNPEPLAEFVDVFFIGEAEEAIQEIVDLRQQQHGRTNYLEALAEHPGFHVPLLGRKPVRRRYLKTIEDAPYPDRPLVPLLKPVHDRVAVEVARGCIRGCRFCQAGIIYRPYRERSTLRIEGLLEDSLRCSGYEELSLASLSTGDHSAIQQLVPDLTRRYRDDRVSVSLPSLRVGTLTPGMIEAIGTTRKTGFTLAPEAGTERLRRVINKQVSDLDLKDAAETIFGNGWSVLKLYFMIGLPTETDEDLDGIIRLCRELQALGRSASKRHVQLNVSVSTFVPKPHTPFQWIGQVSPDEVRRKQRYLEQGLKKRRGISLKPHNTEMSLLEGAFARGDQAMGRVLEEAVRRGCRFDGWTEGFDFAKWSDAFRVCGLDPVEYACRIFSLDEELPWNHVRTGVTTDFLKREYKRAVEAEVTENCRVECARCGLGCADGGTEAHGIPTPGAPSPKSPMVGTGPRRRTATAAPDLLARVRLKFSRLGRVRFLSHLDFMALFHRASVRAGIPVAFSQGFNPHPRISFGPALPVGTESDAEYVDLDTDPFIDLLQAVKDLNATLPDGIRILEARVVPRKAPSLTGSISRYHYTVSVPVGFRASVDDRISGFLSRSAVLVTKDGKEKDIRPCVESLVSGDSGATIDLVLTDAGSVKPRVQDVVEQLFQVPREDAVLFGIKRTAQFWLSGSTWRSPMDI